MKKITKFFYVIYLITGISIIAGCKKTTQDTTQNSTGSVTDIEGNIYKTVVIGTQVWMAESLKTTQYNDGVSIPNVTDSIPWRTLTSPAYCWYDNDITNKDKYGALYNWYAAKSEKLCPTGWHEPTDTDYNTLEMTLGIPLAEIEIWGWQGTDQGTQMKSKSGWDAGGNGTNTSGFNALPGGYRQGLHGTFYGKGILTYFWSSTDDAINGKPTVAWYRRLDGANNRIYKATTDKTGGKYIRCVQN